MGLFDKLFQGKPKELPSVRENEEKELREEKTTDSVPETASGISLLDKHEEGLLDDRSFLRSFSEVKVFYSTPFGDHKDGGSRLFILPAQDETAYLPVFSSAERAIEFYEKVGRRGYMIIEGTFRSFLETTKEVNRGAAPIKLGAVIDPDYYGVTINANALDVVLDMLK